MATDQNSGLLTASGQFMSGYKPIFEANKDAPITNQPRFLFAKKYSEVLSFFFEVLKT